MTLFSDTMGSSSADASWEALGVVGFSGVPSLFTLRNLSESEFLSY